MAAYTMLDLATRQNNDQLTGVVEEVYTQAPEFSVINATPRTGTVYKFASRTSLPTVGFRQINAGVTPSKSVWKQSVREMLNLHAELQVDLAFVKGDDGSAGDILAYEAKGAFQNALITLGNQFYYGTDSDGSNGFVGLRQQISGSVACGGSTNSTTAYLVWNTEQGVGFDVGKDGTIALSPWTIQQIADPNSATKALTAYTSYLDMWVGLSVKSAASVFAATGITLHQTGTTYDQNLTDLKGAQLLAKVPLTHRNGLVWFMNRSAMVGLQASRTSITTQPAGAGGSPAFSPTPDSLAGYPIYVTDSLLDNENNA